MSAEAGVAEAWSLTRIISPRTHVRVAAVDASGEVLNQYSRTWPVERAMAPLVPWAVPLASADGFHLLAFDLDAKRGEAAAAADAAALTGLLTQAGIPHLVCRSGPSGGRHVWTALTEAIDPSLIGTLARLASALLPSLDIAPLRNSATGCVRPPGAPHRNGGRSEILTGDLECLRHPTAGRAAINQLVQSLATQVTGITPAGDSPSVSTLRVDAHGHPYLPGAKRPLPVASLTAMETPTAGQDASVVLNTVLLGAAASHWHLSDVAELVPTAPGLEHIRTRRTALDRAGRGTRGQAETLARQWRYAVQFVAEHPRRPGLDATFDTRAGDLADTVRAAQERADASVGRWSRGGGPSDRRVLDCLHLFALAAVKTTVEADTRRIALTCGIGRETARTALQRLAADGWIRQATPAAGVHGASWQIDPQDLLHKELEPGRAQAATRPEGAGAAERTAALTQLQRRLDSATHDVFTGVRALPLAAGNLYARLVATAPGPPGDMDERLLELLVRHNLVTRRGTAWVSTDQLQRDCVAQQFGVDGRLRRRQDLYRAERAAWAWWQAEQAWMCGPRTRRNGRVRADQTPLWEPAGTTRYPKHPRGPDGRADWVAARTAVHAGALIPALTLLAA